MAGAKRGEESQVPSEENDLMVIRPLYVIFGFENFEVMFFVFSGAGQEVGRSCIMLEFKGKKIMVCLICIIWV